MIYIILCWYVCFSVESVFEKGESIIIESKGCMVRGVYF